MAAALLLSALASPAGAQDLAALLKAAEDASPEIAEARSALQARQAAGRRDRSAYYPRLSLEGGPIAYRDDETSRTAMSGYLSAGLNLYRGGRDSLAVDARAVEARQSELGLADARRKVGRKVRQTLVRLQSIEDHIRLHLDELVRNQEQVQMARRKASGGLTTQADLFEFQFKEAGLKSDVLLEEQERKILLLELRKLTGIELPDGFRLPIRLVSDASTLPPLPALIAAAEQNHVELAAAKAESEGAALAARGALSHWLPSVDLSAQAGRLAFDQAQIAPGLAAEAMLRISIPIFAGFEGVAARTEAVHLREKASAAEERIRRQVRAEVEAQAILLETLVKRIDIEKENLERASKYYELTVAEYRRGLKNSPDLTGATEKLFDARVRRIELHRDLALARLDLETLMGTAEGVAAGDGAR